MAKTILVVAGSVLLAATSLFTFHVYGELVEDSTGPICVSVEKPSCCSELVHRRATTEREATGGIAVAGPVALFVTTAPVMTIDCPATTAAARLDPYAACCDLSGPTKGLEAVAGSTIVAAKP